MDTQVRSHWLLTKTQETVWSNQHYRYNKSNKGESGLHFPIKESLIHLPLFSASSALANNETQSTSNR